MSTIEQQKQSILKTFDEIHSQLVLDEMADRLLIYERSESFEQLMQYYSKLWEPLVLQLIAFEQNLSEDLAVTHTRTALLLEVLSVIFSVENKIEGNQVVYIALLRELDDCIWLNESEYEKPGLEEVLAFMDRKALRGEIPSLDRPSFLGYQYPTESEL